MRVPNLRAVGFGHHVGTTTITTRRVAMIVILVANLLLGDCAAARGERGRDGGLLFDQEELERHASLAGVELIDEVFVTHDRRLAFEGIVRRIIQVLVYSYTYFRNTNNYSIQFRRNVPDGTVLIQQYHKTRGHT